MGCQDHTTRRKALLAGSAMALLGLAGCSAGNVGIRQSDGGIEIAAEGDDDEPDAGNRQPATETQVGPGEYIPTKPEYHHIAAKPLPTLADGSIDSKRVVVEASMGALDVEPVVEKQARGVVTALADDDTELAMSRWKDTLRASKRDGTPLDLNALIQFVIRESYLEAAADLRFSAMRVKYFTDQKRKLREWVAEAKRIQGTLPASCGNDPNLCSLSDDLRQSIPAFEGQLESPCEGDPELANVDLNDALQKQQQTLRLMSNIAKQLHDTAMAVIRNVS